MQLLLSPGDTQKAALPIEKVGSSNFLKHHASEAHHCARKGVYSERRDPGEDVHQHTVTQRVFETVLRYLDEPLHVASLARAERESTKPSTHGPVSSDDAVQKDDAATNHHRRGKDETNGANDRVDGDRAVRSVLNAYERVITDNPGLSPGTLRTADAEQRARADWELALPCSMLCSTHRARSSWRAGARSALARSSDQRLDRGWCAGLCRIRFAAESFRPATVGLGHGEARDQAGRPPGARASD
jgi:hypothetical protein